MTASSQYPDEATYVSVVRTFPNLSAWTVPTMLAEYAELAVRRRDAIAVDAPELVEIEQDLAAVANALEAKATPAAVAPADLPVATYVRRTVARLTEETRRPEQDSTVWDVVHLLGIVADLGAAGYGPAVREAADERARAYGLPAQGDVEAVAR